MKKTSIKTIILIALIVSLVFAFIPNANAATERNANPSNFTEVLTDAEEGDTIILEAGTYDIGTITINKAITLKGANQETTKINGSIKVEADLKLQGVTVSTITDEVILVNKTVNLEVSDCVLEYKGYTETNYGPWTAGICLQKENSDGSTVKVTNTDIYTKYGVWVYSQENNVTIENCNITGWAPVDISNGGSEKVNLAKNNTVTISNSTLTGIGLYNGNSNAYGTIVIGGQDGLELNIIGSTVTNKIKSDNVQDLIQFGDAYLPSKNVTITIESSELVNTDTTNGSSVINMSTPEIADTTNYNQIIVSADTKMTAENGKIYAPVSGYVILTLSTIEGDISISVPEGFTFTKDDLAPGEVEGYTFEGYFIDKDYNTPFDYSALTKDTVLYAKFIENKQDPDDNKPDENEEQQPTVEENKDEEIENPKTMDNVLNYIMIGVVGIIILAGVIVYIKKK